MACNILHISLRGLRVAVFDSRFDFLVSFGQEISSHTATTTCNFPLWTS